RGSCGGARGLGREAAERRGCAVADAPRRRAALRTGRVASLVWIRLLGLFLGMRHATDPDHVIAVTTTVARQRRVGAAALIGVLWGIGHNLTMVAVGGAIIVFGVVIPPRLGLTMELSVALMLILLGVANLAGIMRWITGTSHEEVF